MDVLGTLRRYWGYDSFRPLQERIVNSLLNRKDTCVVMPTGGGKSLCYQLPAAMAPEQTAVVVSPLIALMQDQAVQLKTMGIEAALLNSSMPQEEQSQTIRKAAKGAFRLLYLSPERLARGDTIDWLRRVPISFFAIDEAHCISEWGHEFRPEYRQLSRLRAEFPDKPIAAFTASATQRVRHDIIEQLRLHEPDKYIASFHRANLRYVVRECKAATQPDLLLKALRSYKEGNVIVYAPTIRRVEETADFLETNGIPATAYHGKMDAATRRANQERWTSDEVRVLVGTIAFGLGINKAAVRAVIHLSMPKSVEQYYQEAGRAGRDGEHSDCVLLWQKQDFVLLRHFIRQIGDDAERSRAQQRMDEISRFVDLPVCRHRQICTHFGEKPRWTSCHACDACGYLPEWIKQREAATQPEIRKRSRSTTGSADPKLSAYLREWRRAKAKELGLPAFVVMYETTLEEVCRRRPTTLAEIRNVPGFGEHKTALYGPGLVEAVKRFRGGGARCRRVRQTNIDAGARNCAPAGRKADVRRNRSDSRPAGFDNHRDRCRACGKWVRFVPADLDG
jgi:ATP-dependent DNA helicase RecQ